jgi:hypothetical protein
MKRVHHDDNHEPIWLFDEVVFAKQPWQSTTPCYYLPRTSAPTPIATFVNFQNQPLITNINLVPINSNVKRLQLLNKLEQLCHIDRRPSIQSISIPNLEPVEP